MEYYIRKDSVIPHSSNIFVILPYFNFCKSNKRTKLFLEFIDRYYNTEGIVLVVVEGKMYGEEFQLPKNLKVKMHLGFSFHNYLWCKENLINLAVKYLPSSWNYIAWIDADITFLNPKWVEMTYRTLQDYDVIQLYDHCLNLGPCGEIIKTDKSFGYMNKIGKQWTQSHKYGFFHPGYAWACTKDAYEKMGGLIEFGILGSGDHHMALALINKVRMSHPHNISESYINCLTEFEIKCRGLKLGYVEGTLVHHWHGSIKNRKYVERWQILTQNNYNPRKDITKNGIGVLCYTENGMRFNQLIKEYFESRNEDDETND